MAFLKGCIQGCFDGFGRMEHAMKIQTSRAIPRNPSRHSPFLAGTGVAYNERSDNGAKGVGHNKTSLSWLTFET